MRARRRVAASPAADEALLDPYFVGLHNPAREPLAEPISKLEYDFEKRKLTVEEVRDLIYREVLQYHPQAQREVRCPARAAQRRAAAHSA